LLYNTTFFSQCKVIFEKNRKKSQKIQIFQFFYKKDLIIFTKTCTINL